MNFAYGFFIGLFVTAVAVPLLMKVAERTGILDQPGLRKIHSHPVPRIGGIAVALGFFCAVLFLNLGYETRPYVVIAAMIILAVGIIDDKFELNYIYKILGQSIAIILVIYSGVTFDKLPMIGFFSGSKEVSIAITFLFLFGMTNAFNLIDGLDGLAGGVTILSIGAIGFVGFLYLDHFLAISAITLLGCIIGFLRYNSHPAVVFIGDAGSQFLGFMTAYLALHIVTVTDTAISPVFPFLVLGLPLIDTLGVFIRRILQKRSPFIGDRQHIHHRILSLGLSHSQTVICLYVIQSALVAAAILLRFSNDYLVAGVLLSAAVLLFATIYLAEKSNLTIKSKESKENQYISGKYPFFETIGKISSKYTLIFIGLMFAIIIIFVHNVEYDIFILSLSTMMMFMVGNFLFKIRSDFIIRAASYICITIYVYLYYQSREPYSIHDVAIISLAIVTALSVILSILLKSDKPFQISPLDLLILAIVLTIPILPLGTVQGIPLDGMILFIVMLFYAVEYRITSGNGYRLPLAALSSLSLSAVAMHYLLF